MSKLLSFLFLLFLSSCGGEPLFSSLKEKTSNDQAFIEQVRNNKVMKWAGDTRISFAISWKEGPEFGSKSSMVIKFWDSYQNDFFGPYEKLSDKVCAFLWMKMPDGNEHGSSPISIIENEDSYFFDDIYFIMAGRWELRIRTIDNDMNCSSIKDSPYIHEEILSIHVK
ncbi:hypothetical protein [Halobacteriovorax sp. HLS]|uniref:hypothetical protein n=1 Tax=Halobacteriovorax sp. HLS TaxID=2234000 RepID=UPI000FDB4946|nr:hypothetical protein [Halobacteriovorax sp. HLS]